MKIEDRRRVGVLSVPTAHTNSTMLYIVVTYFPLELEFVLKCSRGAYERDLYIWVDPAKAKEKNKYTIQDIIFEFSVSEETAIQMCEAMSEWI